MKKTIPTTATLIPDEAKLMYQGIIYDTYQWQQELFDGSRTTFEMIRRPDTVEVIAVADDKILLLSDEQPHRGTRLSFPGGRVDDKDEDILRAAQREVHEETGLEFKNWRLVKVWQPQTKIEWFIHLFVTWDVASTAEPHADAGEKITVEHQSFEKVKEFVSQKAGYPGEAGAIFENLNTIEELLALPEFKEKHWSGE